MALIGAIFACCMKWLPDEGFNRDLGAKKDIKLLPDQLVFVTFGVSLQPSPHGLKFMTQKITAVKNLKSQKLFILVGERDGRYRLVSESGEVMLLPAHLFGQDRTELSPQEATQQFSSTQLQQYERQLEKMAEETEKADKNLPYIVAKATSSTTRTRSKSVSGSSTARASKASRSGSGRVVRAWNAPRLTFYRNKIHDLRPQDVIQIAIEGEGTFVITREDFDRTFADVVVSPEFKSQGLFTYPQIPDKARRFFRAE